MDERTRHFWITFRAALIMATKAIEKYINQEHDGDSTFTVDTKKE